MCKWQAFPKPVTYVAKGGFTGSLCQTGIKIHALFKYITTYVAS